MKKINKIISISCLLLMVMAVPVFSQSEVGGKVSNPDVSGTAKNSTGVFTLSNPLKNINSVGSLVQAFIEIFSYIVILFAVLMIIYTGFQYVINAAQGNATKISELNKRLLWLVVGLAVVIGAKLITQVVINTLSATGVVDQKIIDVTSNAAKGK